MASGVCRLCGRTAELRESHLIPKFVFDWMKRTGSPYLPVSGQPNRRAQDGRKYPLLCGDCEQRFSVREGWFAGNIFAPYLERGATSFPYDESLYYFLLSVLWRVLQDDLADVGPDHPHYFRIQVAEHEWRTYLLGGPVPSMNNEVHLFVTDIHSSGDPSPVANFAQYFARAVDHTVASSASRCFAYAKFARFIVIGGISGLDPELFVGTRVIPVRSTLTIPQELRDGLVGEFMLDRARTLNQMVALGTSPNQKAKIAEAFKNDASRIVASDLGAVLRADFGSEIDPTGFWPDPGPDEYCTCGSGKKFKECHGG